MRKGYGFEYKCKQMLKKDGFIPLKLAINSLADYVCLKVNPLFVKLVECKTHKDKWYLTEREKIQMITLLGFHNKYNIPVEYFVREKGNLKVLTIKQAYKKYMK